LDKVLTLNSEYSIKRMVQKTKLLKADKSILGD